MKKLFKVASVFLFLASFIGCKPELELEPTVKTGSIEGKVVYENENVTDYSKIQVSLISTNGLMAASYCEARGIATNARKIEDIMYTDCWGKYSFENVPEGVYTICASSDSSTKKAVLTNVVVTAGVPGVPTMSLPGITVALNSMIGPTFSLACSTTWNLSRPIS